MKALRAAALFLAVLLCILPFSGCDLGTAEILPAKDEPVHLVYYTIGTPKPDLKLVEEAINEVLKEKLNIVIDYNKITWTEYGTRLNTMINSSANFDIAFATSPEQGDYVGNARKEPASLDGYLSGIARETKDAINPLFWEGVKIDGTIYGIPTNKEIAVPLHFTYAESLVNKYNIDITQYKTLASLSPLLQMIHENEPDYIPFDMEAVTCNYFAINDYEYLLSNDIPLMVKSTDPTLQIVNIFETDYCRDILHTLNEYYVRGYINEDAPLKETGQFEEGVKAFFRIAEGGPYSANIWSNDRKYKIVSQTVSDAIVTTESTRGGIMVVNARTAYPEECVRFLNCLNTDPEVRNLFNYGIEGKHYTLTESDQVLKLNNDYAGVAYTQGNWFILKTQVGDPPNKWEQYKLFNNSAYYSEALGFTPNTEAFEKELAAIRGVMSKYYPCLITGAVDADIFLPLFLTELREAGIDEVRSQLQTQISAWKAKN